MARWQLSASAVTMAPFSVSISSQFRHCGDLVRLGAGGYLRQHQALLAAPGTDHVQGRFAAGAIKRAPQDLPIDGHNAPAMLGKLRHEALKRGAKLIRVETANRRLNVSWLGTPFSSLRKPRRKDSFAFPNRRHIHRALATAQHRAQSNHQKLIKSHADQHCRYADRPTPPSTQKTDPKNLRRTSSTLLQESLLKPSCRKYHRWFNKFQMRLP